jgi:hypothetical protein
MKNANQPELLEDRIITRAQARRLASRHVVDRIFKGATVQDGAQAKLRIYIPGNWSVKDTWVVYKNPEEIALRSSDIVVICKRTGRVLYEGSAHDEG